MVEILGGIGEGQLVATSGLAGLNDGDTVSAQVDARAAAASL
jgi:hypothetical protein